MFSKCVAFLLIDLFIHTCANPVRFTHDFDRPNRGAQRHVSNPWHHDWGSWNQQDYWHTTQRVRTEPNYYKGTGAQSAKTSSPLTPEATTPQAVISEVEYKNEAIKSDSNTATAGDVSTTLASVINGAAIYEGGPAAGLMSIVTTEDISAANTGVISADDAISHIALVMDSDINAAAGDFNAAISDVGATTESQITPTVTGEISEPQWHVGIYKKTEMTYMQICGGSLIKNDMVLSAGLCFWTLETNQLPTNQFAAAAGKRYRAWDDNRDLNAQYSEIKDILYSQDYKVISKMHQPCFSPGLAVLKLTSPFSYGVAVKPICLDFDQKLEQLQLRKGNLGMIAGWGVISEGCAPSQHLHWSALPFVPIRECSTTLLLLSEDKVNRFCAGDAKNKAQCETDRGSGLAFLDNNTPYLRGIATFASENKLCFNLNISSFSRLQLESTFLLKYIPSTQECQDFYRNSNQNDLNLEGQNQGNDEGQNQNGGSAQLDQNQSIQNETPREEPNEDGQIGFALGTGSFPVPAIANTSAPSYQWHVGVYSKMWTPYMQICGGSLVKRDVIISAAHCFWDDSTGQQPASQFSVAGGKLYRPWNDTHDTYAQWSNVSQIILPSRFRGITTSFQDDIAVVRLSSPFTYALGVQPACVDFDIQFERQQLVDRNRGTVAGWGLTKANGSPSQRLNYLELPYVGIDDCISRSESSFLKYITSDKICAGDQLSGKALCRGDSGGGLIFFSDTSPYIRGVASTAASNDNLCNAFAIATFTQLHAHRTFLRDNIPDVDKECKRQDSATGNSGVDAAEQDKRVDTTTGNGVDTSRVDLATGGGDKRVDVPTDTPFISKYQPPVPYGQHSLPFNHFSCNCNCKT